jgi:hypothetical protein
MPIRSDENQSATSVLDRRSARHKRGQPPVVGPPRGRHRSQLQPRPVRAVGLPDGHAAQMIKATTNTGSPTGSGWAER